MFGNPDLQRNALDYLQTLRQRPGEPFTLYLPKFERLVAESGAWWSDMTKIQMLEITMDPALKRSMGYRGRPQVYSEYVNTAMGLANDLGNDFSAPYAPARRTARAPPSAPDAMDWEPTRTSVIRKSATHSIAQGCYRCNRPGHIARDCPATKPADNRPGRSSKSYGTSRVQGQQRRQALKTTVEEADDEEEYVSAAEEGKV